MLSREVFETLISLHTAKCRTIHQWWSAARCQSQESGSGLHPCSN